MPTDGAQRRYTDAEARTIFDRALRVESDNRITHDELVAAAVEVGLSPLAVEQAIAEMETAQTEREAKSAIIARRRRRLKNHFVPFVAVNAFFFLVNWLTSPHQWWCLALLLPWSLGLFLHGWKALSSEVSQKALEKELRRPRRKKRRKLHELLREEERVRRDARQERLEHNAKALGEAVEERVVGLLGRLAQDLQRGNAPSGGARVAPLPQSAAEAEAGSTPDGPSTAEQHKGNRV
jgi:hypothetical protein